MPTRPTATLAHGVHHTEVRGRFRRPSLYGDLLRIETRVEELRARAILFRFEFYPETGRELLAEGTATLVAIGPNWKAKGLPERLKNALGQVKMNSGFSGKK